FSLSMMFFTLRTKNVTEASDLSGMAQSFGYLLAALGPVLIGLLQDLFHSWTMPLVLLLICGTIILIVGFLAGRKVVIEDYKNIDRCFFYIYIGTGPNSNI